MKQCDEWRRRYQAGQLPVEPEFFENPQFRGSRMLHVQEATEESRRWESFLLRQQAEGAAMQPRVPANASGNNLKSQLRNQAAEIQMNGATLQNGRQTEPD